MIFSINKLRQIFHFLRGRNIEFDLKEYNKILMKINELKRKYEIIEDRFLRCAGIDAS